MVKPLHTGPTTLTPDLGRGAYVFPVYGPVAYTDTYGRSSPAGWLHGDEIFAPLGAPVLAVTDGTLFLVGWSPAGGNRLWLRDDNDNYYYYSHLAAFSTAAIVGARVHAGQVLGFVGDTGDAVGTLPHLHFEIHPSSRIAYGYDGAVNPTPYLRAWQRLLRLQFTASDLALTTLTGWSAAVAAPSAPPPGAILLRASDISNADRPEQARRRAGDVDAVTEHASVGAAQGAGQAPDHRLPRLAEAAAPRAPGRAARYAGLASARVPRLERVGHARPV